MFSLLLFAILAVVFVFLWLNHISAKNVSYQAPVPVESSSADYSLDSADGLNNQIEPDSAAIPLRDIPLSETQQNFIETAGIDPETFVITPAMQDCAEKVLGKDRLDEITAGATPDMFEATRLVPCLGE